VASSVSDFNERSGPVFPQDPRSSIAKKISVLAARANSQHKHQCLSLHLPWLQHSCRDHDIQSVCRSGAAIFWKEVTSFMTVTAHRFVFSVLRVEPLLPCRNAESRKTRKGQLGSDHTGATNA